MDPTLLSRSMTTTESQSFLNEDQEVKTDSVIPSDEKFINDKLRKLKVKSDIWREFISEILGTFILVFIGDCVLATTILSRVGDIGMVLRPIGWGLGLVMALSTTGGASGCHANPAVTLAFATIGKVKWNRVIPFFLAQYLGAFVAAALVFAVYYDSIADYDGGRRQIPPSINATAQLFASYRESYRVSLTTLFLDQVLASGFLLLTVVAIIDPRHFIAHKGLYPLLIGFSLGGILYALPSSSMAPLNPARDFSSRLFTMMAGYGTGVFSSLSFGYFVVVTIIGPHFGAILGAWIYKLGIEIHWPENQASEISKESSVKSEPLDQPVKLSVP